jgi:hypothetical protein
LQKKLVVDLWQEILTISVMAAEYEQDFDQYQEFELVTPEDGQPIKMWKTKRPPLAERMHKLQAPVIKHISVFINTSKTPKDLL